MPSWTASPSLALRGLRPRPDTIWKADTLPLAHRAHIAPGALGQWPILREERGDIPKKSVFALFEEYQDCEPAVEELMDQDFAEKEVNVIAAEEMVKTHLEVDLSDGDIKTSPGLGAESQRLDGLLGREQAIVLPRAGAAYAAGDMATILAKTAASPGTASLRDALVDFNMSALEAAASAQGVADGALLFWIRTADARASEAAEISRGHNGVHVNS